MRFHIYLNRICPTRKYFRSYDERYDRTFCLDCSSQLQHSPDTTNPSLIQRIGGPQGFDYKDNVCVGRMALVGGENMYSEMPSLQMRN